MPSRFAILAMALAAPVLLVACEREAQQEAEVEQAEEPATPETEATEPAQTAEPAEPAPAEPPVMAEQQPPAVAEQEPPVAEQQPPAPAEPSGEPAAEPEQEAAEAETEGEIAVIPPAEETPPAGEQETAQAEDGPPGTQAPGERSPEAAGVASVAAYVGRWAEEAGMCRQSYWTFTNLRLQSPDGQDCDILSTTEQEDGVALDVGCTDEDQPLADPRRGTMSLVFPDLPQTDTMTVSGGPVDEGERTLSRCPLG